MSSNNTPFVIRDEADAQSSARVINSPYLTTREAAAYCRRSVKTICNHKWLGNVRSVPGTRPPLFRVEDLDAWLNLQRKGRRA